MAHEDVKYASEAGQMAAESLSTLLEYVHRMAQGQDCADVPDRSLLGKFVTQRDESAFSALVQRHGQMVWGVCRRLLYRQHDTEDAFQATFLPLPQGCSEFEEEDDKLPEAKHFIVNTSIANESDFGVALPLASILLKSTFFRRDVIRIGQRTQYG